MRKIVFTLMMALTMALSAGAREIVLLEGPFEADWSDKHCVDPIKMVGVAAGDIIHVYTSNLQNNAVAYIRTRANGWAAISKDYDNVLIDGDIECLLDESLIKVINNQTLMFGGSGYTIERVTLITDRPEDTRTGYDELSNPEASEATRQIYNLLRDCYGERSISCSMAEVNWNYKEAGYVKTWTGHYPAINGYDYIHLTYDWEPYADISPVKDWWDMGGLVTICWHWRAPGSEAEWQTYKDSKGKTPFEGFYAEGGGFPSTTFSTANAVTEGTWENEFVRADLAKVAERLKLLQQAGIVVIWRPLHEAAGNSTIYSDGKAWFWWGADGAAPCVALWRMMYDYFSQCGLDNLIWVWTSQTKDSDWYPGDQYVDMIGRDLYNYSVEDAKYNFEYLTAYYPHKMIALSECGYAGGSSPYMTDQWEAGARWSFGMPWYHYQYTPGNKHQYADKDWWQAWFDDPSTITIDEMRDLRDTYLSRDSELTPVAVPDDVDTGWYTLQGIRVNGPVSPGIYIHNGRKELVR
ncbi:MAG: glycosyl hydrolase [Bacteroidales bacterium]|nr:glycosyl hydrolase [Bacteroidales bacterium]